MPPPPLRVNKVRISRKELVRREVLAMLLAGVALLLLSLFAPAPLAQPIGESLLLHGYSACSLVLFVGAAAAQAGQPVPVGSAHSSRGPDPGHPDPLYFSETCHFRTGTLVHQRQPPCPGHLFPAGFAFVVPNYLALIPIS